MAHADVAFGYCLLFFSLSSLGTSVKVRQLSRETSDYSDFFYGIRLAVFHWLRGATDKLPSKPLLERK